MWLIQQETYGDGITSFRSYYYLQMTVKYRRNLFTEEIEQVILEVMGGFTERYEIEMHTVGFDKKHVHVLCRFLPNR